MDTKTHVYVVLIDALYLVCTNVPLVLIDITFIRNHGISKLLTLVCGKQTNTTCFTICIINR